MHVQILLRLQAESDRLDAVGGLPMGSRPEGGPVAEWGP
jgi:hypothetical protein